MTRRSPLLILRTIAGSLTLRGKGLLAVGLGLAAGAVLSGQQDLLSVALLVMALPVLSWILVSRTGFTLGCTRSVSEHHVAVGDPCELSVTIENLGQRRTSTMLLQEHLPDDLGPAPHRIAPPLRPGDQRRITATVTPHRRGRFRIGPLSVIGVDPLGLVRLRRSFRSTDTILVTPRVVPLSAGTPHAEHVGHGDAALAALAARGDDDVVPREYRIGDDLRRIHWRASARTGQMMVRREELPWTRQATIVLDDRVEHHLGEGIDASVEVALSAVASIGVHLLRSGFDLHVVGLDGATVVPRCSGRDGESLLLDTLALAEPRHQPVEPTAHPWHGDLVIAVLTASPEMGSRLGTQAPRRSGDLGIAFLLDPAQWGDPDADVDQVMREALAGHWRCVALNRAQPHRRGSSPGITEAWTQALRDVTTEAGAR